MGGGHRLPAVGLPDVMDGVTIAVRTRGEHEVQGRLGER